MNRRISMARKYKKVRDVPAMNDKNGTVVRKTRTFVIYNATDVLYNIIVY